jgi:dihydroorotate dehydrogenase electron transfer subunit
MKYKETGVLVSARTTGSYLELIIESPKIAGESRPGQFVNVRTDNTTVPLLRRPLSICDADGDRLRLLVLIRGAGTEKLSKLRPGDSINLIGPLGNPFPAASKPPLYVAGGVGIAPFLFAAKKAAGTDKPLMLFGARSASLLPDLSSFEAVCDLRVATDDGSFGVKGNVIDLLKNFDLSGHTLLACGPTPMFRALASHIASSGGADAWFSLETYMGCGFGACKGCTVEGSDGEYKLCCTDGPTFRWNEVKL